MEGVERFAQIRCQIPRDGCNYGSAPTIVRSLTPLFEAKGQFAVLGTWIIGNEAVGLGMREDRSRITCNLLRFVSAFHPVPTYRLPEVRRGKVIPGFMIVEL